MTIDEFIRRGVRKSLRTIHPALPAKWERIGLRCRARRNRTGWKWDLLEPCPYPRLDPAGAQIGARLYVIGGYVAAHRVLNWVDVLDLESGRWLEGFATPAEMAQSHLALVADGRRFLYAVSGQLGNHCHPATPAGFVYDLETKSWGRLPPLPEARYAATMQLWNGRLHVVAGSKPDRFTPAHEQWSLAVESGHALEPSWRNETPIPRGGPHRASAVCDGCLFVFGGQEGDYVPIPGDAHCQCDGNHVVEWHHAEVYFLDRPGGAWQRAADLAVPVSHTEFTVVSKGHQVVICGGQHYRDPDSRLMKLTDAIQLYDTRQNTCAVVGTLPYRVKTNVVGLWNDRLFSVAGQRDRGPRDPAPDAIVPHTWRARVKWDAPAAR
jgi:Kelch motif